MPTANESLLQILEGSRAVQGSGNALDYYSSLAPGRRAVLNAMFQQRTGKDYLTDPAGFQAFLKTPEALATVVSKTRFQPGVTPNQSPHLANFTRATLPQAEANAALGRSLGAAQTNRAALLFQQDTAPGLLAKGAFLGPEGLAGTFSPSQAPPSAPEASQGPLAPSVDPFAASRGNPAFGRGLSNVRTPSLSEGRGLTFVGRSSRIFPR